jgi:hypothetical protein
MRCSGTILPRSRVIADNAKSGYGEMIVALDVLLPRAAESRNDWTALALLVRNDQGTTNIS